tara:strand:- start:28 stop:450 length:423 start_codon:yes stop_codon:yes gene_type:complete
MSNDNDDKSNSNSNSNNDGNKNELQNIAIIFGFFGGIMTTVAFVPSVIKILMDHKSQTVIFLYVYLVGQILWLIYGALGVASGGQGFVPSLFFAAINLGIIAFMVAVKHGGAYPKCEQKGFLPGDPNGCIPESVKPFMGE